MYLIRFNGACNETARGGGRRRQVGAGRDVNTHTSREPSFHRATLPFSILPVHLFYGQTYKGGKRFRITHFSGPTTFEEYIIWVRGRRLILGRPALSSCRTVTYPRRCTVLMWVAGETNKQCGATHTWPKTLRRTSTVQLRPTETWLHSTSYSVTQLVISFLAQVVEQLVGKLVTSCHAQILGVLQSDMNLGNCDCFYKSHFIKQAIWYIE